ncbi:MAG: cyclic nucleotide-binding domain-containing protein [Candidatus Wallbacteria bacterium]|nr:cyclic nucleotide-binding domain-containing protein [Candidatus Wallbacteria bacterium]
MTSTGSSGLFGTTYADGIVLFHENDPGDVMYVIQEGQVEISADIQGQRTVLCTLGKGDYLGEMALLDSKPRLATATVKGSARIMSLSRDTLLGRIQADPHIVLSLLKLMSHRMRALQESIDELRARGQLDADKLSAAVRSART